MQFSRGKRIKIMFIIKLKELKIQNYIMKAGELQCQNIFIFNFL